MLVRFFDTAPDEKLKYAVTVSRYGDKWVFCRHRQRRTWEIPGGHREPGESIDECAKRELIEETAAGDFSIRRICAYSASEKSRGVSREAETFGMLYFADIFSFDGAPQYEIGEITVTDEFPEKWTYPKIQPLLMSEAIKRMKCLDD